MRRWEAETEGPASETQESHTFFACYARIYDKARTDGQSVAEAMGLVETELKRELELRCR
jgi:hypothetical protein